MKISVFIAAVFAAAAMTVVSHAKETSPQAESAAVTAETQKAGEGGNLLKQLLRAGNAAAKVNAKETVQAPEEKRVSSIDETVTGSTQAARAASAATAEQAGPPYHTIVSHYAARYGVPVSLAHAVITIESNYRPSARGRAGEIGLMQIKPATARMMGYGGSAKELYEPETNIKYGMKYLGKAFKLGGGETCTAILKYNAGHGAKRMNPVSSAYCAKVRRILGAG